MRHTLRWVAALAATSVALAASVVGFAAPAAAMTSRTLIADRWAFVDAAQPRSAFVGGQADLPLGHQGERTARVYYSFDLTPAVGLVVHKADFFVQERSVTDCATDATVELRRTRPIGDAPTWHHPPKELETLGVAGHNTCPGYLTYDLLPVVKAALDRGDTRVTVELRVDAAHESDPAAGRVVNFRGGLDLWTNAAPTVANPRLFHTGECAKTGRPTPVTGRGIRVTADTADAESGSIGGRFAVWPAATPDQRVEVPAGAYYQNIQADLDTSVYPDGTVLGFAAQASDYEQDVSGWSKACYVRVDSVAPQHAPVVSSVEYPNDGQQHGGSGLPGTFKFDAQGDKDVVAYRWTDRSGRGGRVAAPKPGKAATYTYTPELFVDGLRVVSIDAAGNIGPETNYEFLVRQTRPGIRVTDGGVGLPSTLDLASSVDGTTAFGYQVGDGAEQRIAAVDNKATATITFPAKGSYTITVRVYAGDTLVGVGDQSVYVDDQPTIESGDFHFPDHTGTVGVEGSFTFRPRTTHVVAYKYQIAGEDERSVDAAADGTATVRWTPSTDGWFPITVRSVSEDGTESDTAQDNFEVIDPRPSITLPDLDGTPENGGVGLPTRVWFMSSVTGVAEFLYRLDGGPEQTVPAEYDSADLTVTPTHAGENSISVRARYTDGTLSAERVQKFTITSAPLVSSTDYPGTDAGEPGQAGTFTFKPALPGVVSYTYWFDDDHRTVDAAADGTATITWAPTAAGWTALRVTSTSADGTVSDVRGYTFTVRDPRVDVANYYDTSRVGIGTPVYLYLSSGISADLSGYSYRLNDQAAQTVPISEDGLSTQITVIPDRNGTNVLTVWGVRKTGGTTPTTEYSFPIGTAPHVTSAEYPAGTWSGGPGVAGTFHLDGGMPGIVAFEWHTDNDSPVTVDADAQGAATFTYTPTQAWQSVTLYVRGHTADDTWTDTATYTFYVNG